MVKSKVRPNIFLILTAYIFTFVLIYNPQIYGFPLQRLLYPFSILYFVFFRCSLSHTEKKLLLWGILCVVIGFTNTLFQATDDFGMMLISRVFFGVFCANMIFSLLKRAGNDITEEIAIKLIAYTGCVQVVIILLGFFIPELKNLLLELNTVSSDSDQRMFGQALFRGIGWGTFQYAHLAIIMGSSFLCLLYLSVNVHNTLPSTILYSTFALLFITAGILTARSFFIILFIAIIYWSIIYLKKYNTLKYLRCVITGIISFIIVGLSLYIKFSDVISEETLNWMFEFFNNFGESGKFSSGSTDTLSGMWHFPDSLKTWLFGDARTAGLNGNYNYTLSDIGIVNSLYCWGIIGSIAYFVCLYKSFYYPMKLSNIKGIKILIVFILLINLGYQFKETLNLFPISCLFLRNEILCLKHNRKINRHINIRVSKSLLFSR